MINRDEKVVVENINTPGITSNVNAVKYHAMCYALLKIIPKKGDGLTHKEMVELAKPLLPEDIFPDGAKSMWWSKTVQLDLEAKGVLTRQKTKLLRWVQN